MGYERIKWRVQYRLSRKHKWRNAGLFETRKDARVEAWTKRVWGDEPLAKCNGYGFGNTRVVRKAK